MACRKSRERDYSADLKEALFDVNREKRQREEWRRNMSALVFCGLFLRSYLHNPALQRVITTGLEQQDQIPTWNHPSSHA